MRHSALAFLAFCLGALVIYATAIDHPFVIDDHAAIVNHPDAQQTKGLIQLWGHHYWQGTPSQDENLYRPVTILSYWLNAQATPGSAAGFRVINVLLLGGIGACIFFWTRRFAGSISAAIGAAFLIAHPANTEAINHIVGRADLLAVLGIMGFLVIQQNAQHTGWSPKRIAAGMCFALIAVGSKESGFALVPAAIAQHLLFRATHATPDSATSDDPCDMLPGVCPKRAIFLTLFLPVALLVAARLLVVGVPINYEQTVSASVGIHDLTANPLADKGFAQRLPDAAAIAGWYAKQLVLPATTFNHTPAPSDIGKWTTLGALGLAVYASLIAGIAISWRKRRPHTIALVLFAAHLLVVGNLLVPTGVYAANRLTLATTTAGAMLLALLVAPLIQSTYRRRMVAATLASLIGFALATVTAIANTHWSSEHVRMTADALAQQDNPIALYWFAQASLQDDIAQTDTAYVALKKAHMLAPDSAQAALALADVCVLTGKNEEAWGIYTDPALTGIPLTENQRLNAALAAYNTGREAEAEKLLRSLPENISEPIRRLIRENQR